MLLTDNSGIGCDYCGITYSRDFEYYSWDFRPVDAYANRRPTLDEILLERVVSSIDICAACFSTFKKRIVANYSKMMSEKRAPRTKLVCEWTGDFMEGDYTYYHVNVTKVDVRLAGQPSMCIKCDTKTFDAINPCKKCGGDKFVSHAAVNTIQRFVELNLSEAAFKELSAKAESVRQAASKMAAK